MRKHWTTAAVGHGIPAMLAFLAPLGLVAACLAALWSITIEGAAIAPLSKGGLLSDLLSDPYLMRAVRFTLFQAVLSALLSTLLAIPLARAFATRSFPGRGAILSLFGAPFILPVIVAILGILAVWGKGGLLPSLAQAVGLKAPSLYGIGGILLTHVFFNLPLATRILLQGWFAIPAEQWRLASQLGMPSGTIARHIEWPMLKERLPGIFALVFLLCATSFTVILALGGGPKATTIELAIYQAIRYDFDLERAALLAIVQIILCAGLAIASRLLATEHDTGTSLGEAILRSDRDRLSARLTDGFIIALAIAFLGLPLTAALLRGVFGLAQNGLSLADLIPAALRSLGVSLGACTVVLFISLPLAQIAIHLKGRARQLVELPGFAIMVAPPIALGAGLFIILNPYIAVDDLALPLASLLNGLQAMPFALVLLIPPMAQIERNYGQQIEQLGMSRMTAIRLVHWPLMRRPIGLSLGIAAALSMGDLGVIALFGSPSEPTLPLYLYQQMGAYRMDHAYGTGLLLTFAAFAVFLLFEKGLGGHDQT